MSCKLLFTIAITLFTAGMSASAFALDKGTQLECDAAGTTCSSKNMPLLLQTDPDIDDDVASMGAWGCYRTSIVMVASSVLANRTQGTPVGKTAEFLATPVGPKRTSWMYRTPHGFAGMVRDLGELTSVSPPTCDPKPGYGWNGCVSASNDIASTSRRWMSGSAYPRDGYVRYMMDSGNGGLIAFFWAHPVVTYSNALSTIITYTTDRPHKVALSGYQPGAFPLRVNDPGTGSQANIKIGMKVAQQGTTCTSNSFGIKWCTDYTEVLPKGASQWVYMAYEHPAGTPDAINLVELFEWFSVK